MAGVSENLIYIQGRRSRRSSSGVVDAWQMIGGGEGRGGLERSVLEEGREEGVGEEEVEPIRTPGRRLRWSRSLRDRKILDIIHPFVIRDERVDKSVEEKEAGPGGVSGVGSVFAEWSNRNPKKPSRP